MAERAKHAFGSLEKIDSALANGAIDAYDILFVKDANGKPYVGWIDKEGQKVICDDAAEFAKLEGQIATKVNADEIDAKMAIKADAEEVECSYEKIKYEIADVPVGTLVSYRDNEIRVMCPTDVAWTKQTVGNGGDPNCYYATFKTYAPYDNVVGYIEHLGNQVDGEILTALSTDKYGRRYQSTWLAIAKYDESTDSWTYYGANSTTSKYIGWDYQIDWYDANNKIIASDSVRINLSNENCHSAIKPYYGVSETENIEIKIDEAVNTANAYTDAKIAEIAEASSYEIVEF